MSDELAIRRMMRQGLDAEQEASRIRSVINRARRTVGQRDTVTFALVRVWAALAKLLAPVFGLFREYQLKSAYQHDAGIKSIAAAKPDNK